MVGVVGSSPIAPTKFLVVESVQSVKSPHVCGLLIFRRPLPELRPRPYNSSLHMGAVLGATGQIHHVHGDFLEAQQLATILIGKGFGAFLGAE